MGLCVQGVNRQIMPRTELTANSSPGIYVSQDGSTVIKGDSNGKQKKGRACLPATHVQVTSGTNGRTFIKAIVDLKDVYKYVGPTDAFELKAKANDRRVRTVDF
jgi:hypothetical protein